MFGAESLLWNKKIIQSLENAYSQAFNKIFKTYDKRIIRECQFFMGYLPIELLLVVRKLNFLTCIGKLRMSSVLCMLHQNDDELYMLCKQYNVAYSDNACWKKHLWHYFEMSFDC